MWLKNDYLHCFKKKKASPCMKCCELRCHREANLFLPWELSPSGNRKFPNGTLPNSQLSECIKLKSSFQSYSLPSLPSSLDSLPYAPSSICLNYLALLPQPSIHTCLNATYGRIHFWLTAIPACFCGKGWIVFFLFFSCAMNTRIKIVDEKELAPTFLAQCVFFYGGIEW